MATDSIGDTPPPISPAAGPSPMGEGESAPVAGAAIPGTGDLTVRCVTCNLVGMKYDWFETRAEALIEGLRALQPDVVFFQEATIRGHGPVYNQATVIGEALGLPVAAFAPYGNAIEVMSHEQGGIALISRWPILYTENRRLPEGSLLASDNRVALVVRLQTPAGVLHAVTTHLSWRPEEAEMRLVQIGIILDYLSHAGCYEPGSRLIFAGDLNAGDHEPAVQLATEQLQDCFRQCHPADPGYTWNNRNPLTQHYPLPDRRLDYIFCVPGAVVKESRIVLAGVDSPFASDHFAVYAEIAFPAVGTV